MLLISFCTSFFQKKEEGGKEKASIEDSAFEALEKDFQDVRKQIYVFIFSCMELITAFFIFSKLTYYFE